MGKIIFLRDEKKSSDSFTTISIISLFFLIFLVSCSNPKIDDNKSRITLTYKTSQNELSKQKAQILQQQKQEIEKRISELESGRKAVAVVQTDKCNGCGICIDVCPVSAVSIDKHAVVNPKICTACAVCVSECPNGAITITQQKIVS